MELDLMIRPSCRRDARAPRALRLAVAAGLLLSAMGASVALGAPAIRLSPDNRVPACVTPERLTAFLRSRNANLDPRFRDIAHWYKRHGEAWHVRWDYAFYQMAIETNFLTYLRPNGKRGDVDPRQNNFAGIGTTGGGVPGDSYPDVGTGVLAQIQHLVVYSGERLETPVGARTQLKQDHILLASAPIAARRPVTFQDLSGRWAVDKKYGRSIDWVAEQFREGHCNGRQEIARAEPPRGPTRSDGVSGQFAGLAGPPVRVTNADRPGGPVGSDAPERQAATMAPLGNRVAAVQMPAARPSACRVRMASYGGHKALLIRHETASAVEFTALRVVDGFERTMADNFIRSHAPGGTAIGEFASTEAAFAKAYEYCPGARPG